MIWRKSDVEELRRGAVTLEKPIHLPAPSLVAPATGRFYFLDGLRGIASVAVAMLHIASSPRLHAQIPLPIMSFIQLGSLGVAIFFVLSGFVIAYSQRGVSITARYLGNFVLRRSMRLDPPYWAAIGLALLADAVLQLSSSARVMRPSLKVLAAHFFYAQHFLRYSSYNPVDWTLCYEVQYYLLLTLGTALAQQLPFWNKPLAGVKNGSRLFVFGPLVLLSLFFFGRWDIRFAAGISCWFAFFIGVIVWNVIEGSVAVGWLWLYVAAILALAIPRYSLEGFPGSILWVGAVAVTAASIYAAGKVGGLERWLSSAIFQFFGRISYSLYLVHFPLLAVLNPLGDRICGGSIALSLLWTVLEIGACVSAGCVMYRFVERPAHCLAKRFKTLKVSGRALSSRWEIHPIGITGFNRGYLNATAVS